MIPDDVLRRVAVGGAAWAALSLLLLKHSHDGTLLDGLVAWADLLRQVRAAPDGWAALMRLIHYILKATNILAKDLGRTLGCVLGPEAEEITMSTAERLRIEGRTEGRAVGETLATRSHLLRLIGTRFGPPPDGIRSKIEAADLASLETWFDRALTATDIQAVFADPAL